MKPAAGQPADVFVSYAREDLAFVRRLRRVLESADLHPWIDVEGMYGGEEFWPEICKAIDAAAAFLFVMTPDSVASTFCRRELDRAIAQQKRIVPVCRRAVEAPTLVPALSDRQWVFAREEDDIAAAEAGVLQAIRADWLWLRHHARLLVRTEEWKSKARDRSLLLRGRELREAEAFLITPPPRDSKVTSDQELFVRTSRAAARQRALALSLASAAAFLTIVVVGWFGLLRQIDLSNADAHAGLTDEAIAALTRSERLCSFIPVALSRCDEVTINLGIADLGRQRYDEGFLRLSPIIDGHPGSADQDEVLRLVASARRNRAYSLIMQAITRPTANDRATDYARAQADIDAAAQIYERVAPDPRDPPLAIIQARVNIGTGQFKKALENLDAAAGSSVEPLITLLRSITYRCLGKRPTSQPLLDKSQRLFQEYIDRLPLQILDPQWRENRTYYERIDGQC
jgi:tetratricopeptide (TPR) repeat protein